MVCVVCMHHIPLIAICRCVNEYCFPHAGRYHSKQFYELEILKGHIELGIDKVVMYGIAGSGKTSALAAMLGRDPLTIRSSTPLMKRPINVMFMCVNEKTEWKIRTVKQMQNTVAEVIYSRMPSQQAKGSANRASPQPAAFPHLTQPPTAFRKEKCLNIPSHWEQYTIL